MYILHGVWTQEEAIGTPAGSAAGCHGKWSVQTAMTMWDLENQVHSAKQWRKRLMKDPHDT